MTRISLVLAAAGCAMALSISTTQPTFAGEPVNSEALVEARAFLDDYQALSTAQTPNFYALYSDRAVIRTRVEGKPQGIVFQGRAFKQWGRVLVESRRATPDASRFVEPTVEQRGARLVIRGKRWSIARCYWDVNYAVGIEKEGASFRIVEERLTTNPAGVCSAAAASTEPVAVPVMAVAAGRDPLPIVEPPAWRPLSPQEIADTALRLAQQSTARYSGPVQSAPISAPVGSASPTGARPRREEPASTVWVTPEE